LDDSLKKIDKPDIGKLKLKPVSLLFQV
jgi:hypothetical protein